LKPALEADGYRVVVYDGRTSDVAREEAKALFQQGEANVFLGNPAAGGRGLNLFRAEFELFYANYFGLRRRLQAEDRGHRIGSSTTQPVIITDLVARNSIDVKIVRALRNNLDVARAITSDPRQEWI
jgi:SNF2 family DNA or RNA helicase